MHDRLRVETINNVAFAYLRLSPAGPISIYRASYETPERRGFVRTKERNEGRKKGQQADRRETEESRRRENGDASITISRER